MLSNPKEIAPYALVFPQVIDSPALELERLLNQEAKDVHEWFGGNNYIFETLVAEPEIDKYDDADDLIVKKLKECTLAYIKNYELNNILAKPLKIDGGMSMRHYFPNNWLGLHSDWHPRYANDKNWTITVNIYFNDDYDGGELVFYEPSLKLPNEGNHIKVAEYKPSAGDIIIFPSLALHSVNQIIGADRFNINSVLIEDQSPTWYMEKTML